MADPQTEAYRAATGALAASTALIAARTLRATFDFASPLDSFTTWVRRTSPLVWAASMREAELARREYARVIGPVQRFEMMPTPTEAYTRSMFSTAFETLQKVERTARRGPDQEIERLTRTAALNRAEAEVQGSTIRHTLGGARNSTIATVKSDARVIGAIYLNHPDGKACYWCKMLASRGPTYKGNSFDESDRLFSGGGTAKVHDSCRCVLRPVTVDDVDLLADSREQYEKWLEVTKGYSGADAVKRWRQYVEGRLRDE